MCIATHLWHKKWCYIIYHKNKINVPNKLRYVFGVYTQLFWLHSHTICINVGFSYLQKKNPVVYLHIHFKCITEESDIIFSKHSIEYMMCHFICQGSKWGMIILLYRNVFPWYISIKKEKKKKHGSVYMACFIPLFLYIQTFRFFFYLFRL